MMANYDNYYCSRTPLTFRVCLVDGRPSCYLHGHPHGIAFSNLRPDACAGGTRWLSRFGPLLQRFPVGLLSRRLRLRCELLDVGKEVTTENPARFEDREITQQQQKQTVKMCGVGGRYPRSAFTVGQPITRRCRKEEAKKGAHKKNDPWPWENPLLCLLQVSSKRRRNEMDAPRHNKTKQKN